MRSAGKRIVATSLALYAFCLRAEPVIETYTYESTVTAGTNGPLDLVAELNYDRGRSNAPIAVVMHGYSGSTGKLGEVRGNAQYLRDKGFFAVSVAMRGRDGSEGTRDSGGLEIYDIYDAVEAVKRDYAQWVNPGTVYLTGYSGGGGNTMAALCKFPDAFNAGAAFFGMSDYGYHAANGWYFDGASSSHRAQMRTDIGDPTSGVASVTDRYHARASNLASANNPYSEIHLFVNANETTCPPINMTTFLSNAVSREAYAGEFSNITVHIGQAGLYHDFNSNGLSDADEQQYWPHGAPTANQQAAAESWFMERLLAGQVPRRTLNAADSLVVAGFVKTSRFECRAGDGQQGALRLDYAFTASNVTFHAEVLSLNAALPLWLSVNTASFSNQAVAVWQNSTLVTTFAGGGVWSTDALRDGDTLELRATGQPYVPAPPVFPKLLAYYDLDGSLADQTTNAYHGTAETSGGAGVAFTSQTPPALSGISGGALVLDGSCWVRLPFLNVYGMAQARGVTVSLWAKGGSSASTWLLAEGNTADKDPAYCLGTRSATAALRALVRTDTGGGLLDRDSAGVVFNSQWHHVVWSDRAGATRLYIDGVQTDTAQLSYSPGALTLNTTTLGALVRGASDAKYPFVGMVDDVSVWPEVLGSNAVSALASGVPPLQLAGLRSEQPVLITGLTLSGPTNLCLAFSGPALALQPRPWYTTNLLEAEWTPVPALNDSTMSGGVFIQSFEAPPSGAAAFFKIVY